VGLITVEEAREYLPGIGSGGADGGLGRAIDRASAAIAQHLGFPSRSASLGPSLESYSYTIYSGIGEPSLRVADDGRTLILPVRPITAIASIYDDPDYLTYGSSYLVAASDYSYDAIRGRIYLLPAASHGAWSTTDRAVRVIVTAGWSTIPDPIREACVRTVQAWWVDRRSSAGQDGVAPRWEGGALPGPARALLAPYEQPHGWVA
jgi:hypothetical protein